MSDAEVSRFADIGAAGDFDPIRFNGDGLHAILRDDAEKLFERSTMRAAIAEEQVDAPAC